MGPRPSANARTPLPAAPATASRRLGDDLTSALPTTAASAHRPTARTCSGCEMPKPSATGSEVARRMRATSASAPSATVSRAPVTPSREMRVQEPAAQPRRVAEPLRCRRRAQQEDCINVPRVEQALHARRPPRSAGRAQHAVHAGRRAARSANASTPRRSDRVGVGEEHDRRRPAPRARRPPGRARRRASCRRPAPARSPAESPGRRPADPRTARRPRSRRRPRASSANSRSRVRASRGSPAVT